jgi:osmotically-inducible protein OsmY
MKTDSDLRSDVRDELKLCSSVNAANIGVAAYGGVVTLTGHVPHYTAKAAAEEAAKGVSGVKRMANDIMVDMPGSDSGKWTDQDIGMAALSAMKWDLQVPHDRIKASVREGRITLEGSVDCQVQKDAAKRCVRCLMGVTAVTNLITITHAAKWIIVKKEIGDTLRRNAKLAVRCISVNVLDGVIAPTGTELSWPERRSIC